MNLQRVVEDEVVIGDLSNKWLGFDFESFSKEKKLFKYQQKALENALKGLYLYYGKCGGDKKRFYEEFYRRHSIGCKLELKDELLKLLQEYEYDIEGNSVAFWNFVNRMGFWMATGSGKTLVIIKLIELLNWLKESKILDVENILFLTYRDDLIEQFKRHVEEFNQSSANKIILHELKKYADKQRTIWFGKDISVYYYRSDLLSDEQKDKIVDFRNYDNGGKWFIILDEAHKGDKEESKRQIIYSLLSRNGFMFNFSATFTDDIDKLTCVYNFNLERFIQEGYGKHIYISQADIQSLGKKKDFDEERKKVILLKIFLLYTLIKKKRPEVYSYHKPLILVLANSVNTEDADLELFFKEVEKIAKEEWNESLLEQAKQELHDDIKGQYEFENGTIEIREDMLRDITYRDILEYVFNAKTGGAIEVWRMKENKQELAFKLKTSDKPFALIKIGDISQWLKDKLTNYEILESFVEEGKFMELNKETSDINILMGSRAFYEGWDSNRPNIILYINIGKGKEAKKFVLQSIGRGVRIEPLPNKRQRLEKLKGEDYKKFKEGVDLIETLFVFGTRADNLKEIAETLKEVKEFELLELFEKNPKITEDILLLIPVYEEKAFLNVNTKYSIHPSDFELFKTYLEYIGDKVLIAKYDCPPKVIEKVRKTSEDGYYRIEEKEETLNNADILLRRIFNFFSLKAVAVNSVKPLEEEIIHFKHVKVSKEKIQGIKEAIEKVKRYPERDKKEKELEEKIKMGKISLGEATEELKKYSKKEEIKEYKLRINYVLQHYYIPVVLSEDEKVDYIKHIIKTKSEVKFIEKLEEYLQEKDNLFEKFDWWFFSKIDESLDEVYIPYYQPKTNRIEKFKPDFIFWLKKDKEYFILFIDPKSIEFTDAYRKIEGYRELFENKAFNYNGLKVRVYLRLWTDNKAKVLKEYEAYWINDFKDLLEIFPLV